MKRRKIFVSYRRSDLVAKGLVGRIHDRLANRYGSANVFLDDHALEAGAEFPDVLRRTIASSDLVLAVIGPQWLDILTARSDDDRDFVRAELETAIENKEKNRSPSSC